MKKLSCILLAVMLITALFVSCTAEVIDPYDGLAYVTFGGPASKDLSASYEVQSYEDLYWFYTAQKADDFGKTGEVTDKTPVSKDGEGPVVGLGGQVGPLSQGLWDFELFAYSSKERKEGTLVYKGSVEGIKLTSSSLTSVPVSVTPQGDSGTIEFRNAYFRWNEDNGGSDKPTIKITAVGTSKTYTLLSGISAVDEYGNIPLEWSTKDGNLSIDSKYPEVLADYYNCKIVAWVINESSPIFEQSFGIRVYGSATTVISGDITEKVDSFVDFEVSQEDLVVFKGASTMEVLSTPSNASDKFTTVDFGSNLDGNKTYSLSVKSTTAAEAASKFTVSDGEASVAGIDLTLTTDNNPVTSFDSEITITTYIAAGLDKNSVRVLYGNEGKNYLTDYNSTTGKLVFKTNHFSEYYVVTDAVASIGSIGYAFLQDAIDAATDGDIIIVQKDIQWTEKIEISGKRKLTIDLNGHSIVGDDGDKSYLFDIYDAEVLFTGKGVISDTAVWGYAPIGVKGNSDDCSNYTVVTIDSEVVIKGFYGIMATKDSNGSYNNYGLVVNVKGTIEVPLATCPVQYGGAAIYINGSNKQTEGNVISINLEGATLNVDKGIGIYAAGYAKWNIEDTTINGADAAIEIRAGEMVIESGEFTASTTPTEVTPNGNGSTTSGSALAVAQHTTQLPVLVNIAGGTFKGYSALYESNSQGNSSEAIAKVRLSVAGGTFNAINGGSVAVYSEDCTGFITGGTFNSNPSKYVADGYVAEYDEDSFVWTVKKAVAEVDGFYFASLEAAFEKALALENPVMTILDDIDLSGKNWIPIKIGSENNAVKSLTIEGNGHSINNMTIAIAADNNPKGAPQAGSSNYYGEGFIAEVYTKTLTIRNLTFNSANVNDSGMDETPEHHTSGVSVVVGRNCYSTVNLENVNVIDSKVYGGEKVGALIGHCMGGKTNINGGSVKNTTVTCTWYYSAMLIGFAHDKARITVNEAVLESNSNTYDLKWSDVTASYTTTEGDTVAWEPYGNPGLWVYAAWKDQIAMTGGTEESTYNNGTYEGKINGHALSFTKVGTAYSGDWTL